jgi:hypothetical protein
MAWQDKYSLDTDPTRLHFRHYQEGGFAKRRLAVSSFQECPLLLKDVKKVRRQKNLDGLAIFLEPCGAGGYCLLADEFPRTGCPPPASPRRHIFMRAIVEGDYVCPVHQFFCSTAGHLLFHATFVERMKIPLPKDIEARLRERATRFGMAAMNQTRLEMEGPSARKLYP